MVLQPVGNLLIRGELKHRRLRDEHPFRMNLTVRPQNASSHLHRLLSLVCLLSAVLGLLRPLLQSGRPWLTS